MIFARKTIERALGITLSHLAAISLCSGCVPLAEKPDPYTMADKTWITISGTVDSIRRDNFTLDYGDGAVVVEMVDGDRDADAYKRMPGDELTVSGRIDDESFDTWTAAEPLEISEVIIYGTVLEGDTA